MGKSRYRQVSRAPASAGNARASERTACARRDCTRGGATRARTALSPIGRSPHTPLEGGQGDHGSSTLSGPSGLQGVAVTSRPRRPHLQPPIHPTCVALSAGTLHAQLTS